MVPAQRRWRFPLGMGEGSRLERAEVLVRGAECSHPEEAEVPARRWHGPVGGSLHPWTGSCWDPHLVLVTLEKKDISLLQKNDAIKCINPF